MIRIGLVGTESDHAEDYLRLLNRVGRHGGFHATAIWGFEAERTATLARDFDVAFVAPAPEAMLGKVDAVIVGDRHGGEHLAHALPFLAAGLPVFVDKPLACTVEDAEALVAAAEKSGALLSSASALRWQTDTDMLVQRAREMAPLQQIVATGSFYPESQYGGSFFYGIHAVELALQLSGADISEISARAGRPDELTISYRADPTEVTIRLTRPKSDEKTAFGAELIALGVSVARQVALPDDYMAPVLDRFIEMIRSGRVPLSRPELLAPVQVMATGEAALRRR